MGIASFIGWIFGADAAAPPDAIKLDGTTEATLARSLSTLPPDERGWITFGEARILFSTKGAQYAFGETGQDGRRNIESFAAQHRSVINFMPVEGRSVGPQGQTRKLVELHPAQARQWRKVDDAVVARDFPDPLA